MFHARFPILLTACCTVAVTLVSPPPAGAAGSRLQRLPFGINIGEIALNRRCKTLVEWSSRVPREYPALNLERETPDVRRAVNKLFGDEAFEAAFKKRFDAMSAADRAEYAAETLRPCFASRQYRDDLTWQRRLLPTAFAARNPRVQKELDASVAAERAARRELPVLTKELDALPATVAGFQRLDEIAPLIDQHASALWPSTAATYAAVSQLARERLAEPTVAASVEALIASVRGVEGLAELTKGRQALRPLLEALPANRRDVYEQRLDARTNALLAEAMAAERAALQEVGVGLAGLVRGQEVMRRFDTRYAARFATSEVVRNARAGLLEERARHVAQAAPALRALIDKAPTHDAIDELLDQHLGVEGDFDVPIVNTLVDAAAVRKEALSLEEDRQAAAALEAIPTATLVAQCDALAKHPDDPAKGGTGIHDDAVRVEEAVDACATAVERTPTTARLHFQLGRAYWAGKAYEDALTAFLKAEELGHAPSYYYLAQMYERGLIAEQPAEPDTAADMYLLAAAEGFEPAISAYEQHAVLAEIGDFSRFAAPRFAEFIFTNKFPDVASSDRKVFLFYAKGVEEFLAPVPNEFEPSCAGVMDGEFATALRQVLNREVLSNAFNLNRFFENIALTEQGAVAKQDGTDDIYALAAEYGGCDSLPVQRFYENLKSFIVNAAR